MTETKNPTKPGFKMPAEALKDVNDSFQTLTDAGRRAFHAYIEAGAQIGAQVDRLSRAQLGHMTTATKETADVMTTIAEVGFKASETARKAAFEAFELAAAGK